MTKAKAVKDKSIKSKKENAPNRLIDETEAATLQGNRIVSGMETVNGVHESQLEGNRRQHINP